MVIILFKNISGNFEIFNVVAKVYFLIRNKLVYKIAKEIFDQNQKRSSIGSMIKVQFSVHCNSDKPKVQDLNYEEIISDDRARKFAQKFREVILQQTRFFLDKMNKAEIEIIHDFYLKKFQQSLPQLPYEFILFDEAQDASDAMLDMVACQPGTKVIVGDTHQQIYGWRFAVNSLKKVDNPIFHLTGVSGSIMKLQRLHDVYSNGNHIWVFIPDRRFMVWAQQPRSNNGLCLQGQT